MLIRPETPADLAAVHAINASAFDNPSEARLVDALRAAARPLISLVAEDEGEVVGHILFTPVDLDGRDELAIMGLAPVAVMPARQREGVGSALVIAGLSACRDVGAGAVAVLGHPEFYTRFGFATAANRELRCAYAVPEEYFMVQELQPDYLAGASGTLRYHSVFDDF
ncbi:MAG: N-acetyltransferase [Zoogloea sp.]|nr:N-acetyltransferase [Zoogloea sp.]